MASQLVSLGAFLLAGLVVLLTLLALDATRIRIVREDARRVLVMALAQQAFVLTRAWLRVALLGSEIALVERLRPLPVPAPLPAEAPQAVSEPEPPGA